MARHKPVVVADFFVSSVLFELAVLDFLAGLVSALFRRGFVLTGSTLLGDCGCIWPADIWRSILGAWSSPALIFLAGTLLLSSTVFARPTTAMEDRLLTAVDEGAVTDLLGDVRVESVEAVATLAEAGDDSFDLLLADGLGI